MSQAYALHLVCQEEPGRVRAEILSALGRRGPSGRQARRPIASTRSATHPTKARIDRLRLLGSLTTEEAVARRRTVNEWLEAIDLVLVRPPVLSRASDPMPMSLGTLDALHLATALVWRDRIGPLPTMMTHDTALGLAAQAFGFDVRGI